MLADVPKDRFVGGPYRGISVQISDPDDIQAQIDNRTSRRTTVARAGHYICDQMPDIGYGGVGITIEAHWQPDSHGRAIGPPTLALGRGPLSGELGCVAVVVVGSANDSQRSS